MKHWLLFVLILAGVGSASAQQHLKFMGVPIDGNIESFSAKLKAKGLTLDPDNKTNKNPSRWFEGTFFEHRAWFCVDYSQKTKNVYQVFVKLGWSDDRKVSENIKKQVEQIVKEKYIYEYKDGKAMNGDDLAEYFIKDENGNTIGEIYMGVHWDAGQYYFRITYLDMQSYTKFIEMKNQDI